MFLTGPGVVKQVTGEDVTGSELGGPWVQGRNGVCHLVAMTTRRRSPQRAAVLPAAGVGHALRQRRCLRAADRGSGRARPVRGTQGLRREGHDPRAGGRVADAGALAEVRAQPDYRLRADRRAAGGVRGQPAALARRRARRGLCPEGRPLRAYVQRVRPATGSAGRRVRLPAGYGPGGGRVLRRGAKLLHAFAEERVPKVTVILRKVYGGGFITMNSRALGADLVLARPDAEIGWWAPSRR